jgi:hypothetical protein
VTAEDAAAAAAPGSADERLRALEQELLVVRGQRDAAWGQIEAMRRSVWWRGTWPLRRLAARLPRGR